MAERNTPKKPRDRFSSFLDSWAHQINVALTSVFRTADEIWKESGCARKDAKSTACHLNRLARDGIIERSEGRFKLGQCRP